VGEGTDAGVEAVALETPSPVYTEEARRGQLQGTVIAEIRIDRSGNVESARATSGSGSPLLDEAALSAVRTWKYRPATLNGLPTPSVRKVRFIFKLE
jgi:protein TonB